MRAPFMAGTFSFPVKYGYATVGVVESGAADFLGRAVFALHPHQTLFDVPIAAAGPLPPHVPEGRPVLAAHIENASSAAWGARAGPFARVALEGGAQVG